MKRVRRERGDEHELSSNGKVEAYDTKAGKVNGDSEETDAFGRSEGKASGPREEHIDLLMGVPEGDAEPMLDNPCSVPAQHLLAATRKVSIGVPPFSSLIARGMKYEGTLLLAQKISD